MSNYTTIREALKYAIGFADSYQCHGRDERYRKEASQVHGKLLAALAELEADRTIGAKELAMRFHDTYERLAPSFGYETRKETRTFDPDSPNGKLMIAVCAELGSPKVEGEQAKVVEEARNFLSMAESFAQLHVGQAGYGTMIRGIGRFKDVLIFNHRTR